MSEPDSTQWHGPVAVSISDRIATLTLARGQENQLDPGVMEELRAALLEVDTDPRVDGILLTGAGPTFCTGLDIAAIRAGGDPGEFVHALVQLLDVFPTLGTLVAAAVNGDALAAGAALVAGADFAAARPSVTLGTYEVSVGVWPLVAQVPIIHRIGSRNAMENIGSGVPFSAERARELGLVQVIADDPVAVCRDWLERGARAGSSMKYRTTVYEFAELSHHDALTRARQRFLEQFEAHD